MILLYLATPKVFLHEIKFKDKCTGYRSIPNAVVTYSFTKMQKVATSVAIIVDRKYVGNQDNFRIQWWDSRMSHRCNIQQYVKHVYGIIAQHKMYITVIYIFKL